MSPDFDSLTNSAVIRTGDTLVVGINNFEYNEAELDGVKADIERALPGVRAVVIQGATSMTLFRPDGFTNLETKEAQQ